MSRRRQQKQADDLTELQEDQVLCVVKGTSGSNTFECSDGLSDSTFIAELPPRFRKTLWIRRGDLRDSHERLNAILIGYKLGSYVIVTLHKNSPEDLSDKLRGEIAAVLQADQIRSWKKAGSW